MPRALVHQVVEPLLMMPRADAPVEQPA